jgi:hypothetical protein
MSRLHTAVATVAIACGLMLAPAAANAAQGTATPLTQKVNVTGSKGFKGTYTIDRFIAKGGKLYSVGTLTGKAKGSKKVTKTNVRMPATTSTGAQKAQLPPIPGACQVLNLVLGPINLNLLGLSVRTNQINLRIDAVPGAGNLLGNLLCGITNLLNPATTPLSQLAQILSALTALSPPNPA